LSAAPIIVTALFGDEDFHWLDRQRREFYPPERNQLRAHLTMFSHLPPSCEAELCQRLRADTLAEPPRAQIDGLMSLDTGVAYRIDSPELEDIRANLAEPFERMLTPQDASPWYPHVTIQNKVKPAIAKSLMAQLWIGFRERPLHIAGLAAFYYRGGPWKPIAAYRFGSGHPMKVPPPLIAS
jgi:2'-5' RNA ligase superfamily